MRRNPGLSVSLATIVALALAVGCALHGNRHRVDGTVVAVSADARTLDVADREGHRLSVALGEKTDYRQDDSHEAKVSDLKPGLNVIVIYDTKDGVNQAAEVHVFTTKR